MSILGWISQKDLTLAIRNNAPLIVLALLTAIIYIVGITNSGIANSYYSAAIQAGTQSWQAFYFGASDPLGFISIDKPPLGIWPSIVSARLFGFSSFSVLLPHALAGIASVVFVYLVVRRYFAWTVAFTAGLLMMATPAAVLMFRYNNPDSFLTLFMIASLYAFLRLIESKRHGSIWAIVAGLLLGLAFMTKGLQIIPLAALYFCFYVYHIYSAKIQARVFAKRIAGALGAFIVVSLTWPLSVALTPTDSRPYVGSTDDDNIWSLLFGYNGIGRLAGAESSSAAGLNQGVGFGGEAGLLRMFNSDFGPNIGWFLGAAFVLSVAILIGRQMIAKRQRSLVFLSAGWLVIYVGVFSFMQGTIHPHYAVVLAPPIAILIAVGFRFAWSWYMERRDRYKFVLPATIFTASASCAIMLSYYETILSGYGVYFLLAGLLSSSVLLVGLYRHVPRAITMSCTVVGCLTVLVPNSEYAVLAHTMPHYGMYASAAPTQQFNPFWPVDDRMRDFLMQKGNTSTWVVGSQSSGPVAALQLATSRPALAVGGFNGSDPAISLQDFKNLAQKGEIRFFLISSYAPVKNPVNEPQRIVEWVEKNGEIGAEFNGAKLYDLRGAANE